MDRIYLKKCLNLWNLSPKNYNINTSKKNIFDIAFRYLSFIISLKGESKMEDKKSKKQKETKIIIKGNNPKKISEEILKQVKELPTDISVEIELDE